MAPQSTCCLIAFIKKIFKKVKLYAFLPTYPFSPLFFFFFFDWMSKTPFPRCEEITNNNGGGVIMEGLQLLFSATMHDMTPFSFSFIS